MVERVRPDAIPWTPMATRYKALKKQHASRLRQLAFDLADPEPLIDDFTASLSSFAKYGNDERFYPPSRKPLPNTVAALKSGRDVMAAARNTGVVPVVGEDRAYRFVDYELVPTRTTPGTIRFDNGRTWRSALRLDLLLATMDGDPVIAEVKVSTDKDPYFALVQALAHAAHLATPNQLARLRACYPDWIRGGCAHDAVVLAKRPPRGNYLELLLHGAQLLAAALAEDERVTSHLGSIEFLEANLNDDGRLSLFRLTPPTRSPTPVEPLRELRKTIATWEAHVKRRYGARHALLDTTSPRDIWWFKDAAQLL